MSADLTKQEFPVVLLHWVADDETSETPGRKRLQTKATFQRYVKPTWQPKLSEFCTTLTGIQQVSLPLLSTDE